MDTNTNKTNVGEEGGASIFFTLKPEIASAYKSSTYLCHYAAPRHTHTNTNRRSFRREKLAS